MITRKYRMSFEDRWLGGNLCSFTVTAAAAASAAGAASVGGVSAIGATTLSGAAIASASSVGAAGLGASSLFSFSNILSFASGISQLAGGILQGQQLDAQSELEALRAENELINGRRDVLSEKEALLRDLASFNARQAGSGSSTVEGSPAAAKKAAIEDSEFQTDITRRGARIRAATRRTSAANIATSATSARVSGLSGALATGARAIDRNTRRA